jgi:hypothetical protein
VQGQQPTWSAEFRAEFQARRGYDLLPFLPALARRVVDGRTQTGRFFHDFRHTIGDLMAEKFFGRFAELSHARGVEMHAETGYGTYPHPHFDGLRCAGACDVTMGEFWHGTDIMSQFDPFCNVIRSVASAAHVYGRRLVQAEAFTSWNHFVEYPFALKAVGDQAFCDGLNRMVFHQYTHQPQSDFKPGRQYGAGTHLDRHLTWWEMSRAWFQYLARCQSLLQAGRFHADVCYFYGEGATRYVPGRSQVKPALPFGYDFDCVNADVLLNRLAVKEGRLALPGGLSYRLLVLPEERVMSPRVLQRLRQLVEAGATVVGARPLHAPGLSDYPRCDQQVREEADALWGVAPATVGHRRLGKGTLVWGKELAEVLSDLGLAPDLEAKGGPPDAKVGFIHRVIDGTEAYFVSNQSDRDLRVDMAFRVRGKRPELWEPVSGGIRPLPEHRAEGTRTLVPVQLAPFQSFFVLFRDKPARGKPSATGSFPTLKQVHTLAGPWEVAFDPKWGGPEKVVFETLDDWSQRPEEGIKYYSGTATYRRLFDLEPAPIRRRASSIYLDLGAVRNLARVRLNGHDLGVVWCAPWRVEITAVVKPSGNQLEVQVVNLWPNRLIGDARSPKAKPFTKTNVTTHNATSSLLPSGLLGPVTLWTTAPER